jgi:putative DNA primase/helicase
MLKRMHSELAAMPKDSGRNTAVYNKALAVGNYVAGARLDEDHAIKVLLHACNHNGLVKDDGERSVLATIHSGIRNGKARPRAAPGPERSDDIHAKSPEGFVSDEGHNLDLEPFTKTDDGNALRLISGYGDKFRRVADMHRWFHWDDARWAVDHDERKIREAAREMARSLPEGGKGDSFKRVSMSATGISSAVRLAQSDPRVSILAVDLDSYPELINTPSGVVDLRAGIIMPHDPALLLTRVTAYAVDLDEPHPRWDEFLAETFEKDAELINYMQRLCGLALLGDVRDHVLPFLHGVGANGKGVLTLVLQGLLGDADAGGYAVSAPDGFLMTGREGKHETEIARLRGARLGVCAEQTSGKRFDESKVKRLTGGDQLTGRFMRGDFFDFPPSHLVWVLSNHLPAVREGGRSFWRRVHRIPFRHVVPEDQRIPDLHDQLLAEEGPAILGWAIRGAVEVLANGLRDPESVITATREYEIGEDTLASLVADECMLGHDWWCKISDFRERYERHSEEMGAEPLSAKAISMRLASEYGVITGQRHSQLKVRIYRGIALQADNESSDR